MKSFVFGVVENPPNNVKRGEGDNSNKHKHAFAGKNINKNDKKDGAGYQKKIVR